MHGSLTSLVSGSRRNFYKIILQLLKNISSVDIKKLSPENPGRIFLHYLFQNFFKRFENRFVFVFFSGKNAEISVFGIY